MPRRPLVALVLTGILHTAPVRAEAAETGPNSAPHLAAGARHASWQICLHDAFALRARLSSPDLAADAALHACRPSEAAYLDALALSPLADEEDVARIRPALVARARLRLLGGRQL